MDYTSRDLAQAVLHAHPDSKRGLDMFRGAFSDDMKGYQGRLRDALRAFDINLEAGRAVAMMLRGVVDSNAAITGPSRTSASTACSCASWRTPASSTGSARSAR